jgi:hypothetical protein
MNAKEARRVIGGRGIEGWRWAIERPGEGVVAERPTDAKMISGTSPPGGRWTRKERGAK